jgi:hypothetical protein
MSWHRANERYLVDRRPVATVAIGWSQHNLDFFGRANVERLVKQPNRGFLHALVRARIPYCPLHLDHLDRDGGGFSVLILPNIGAMSDAQVEAVRRFVQRGGALIATGQTSRFDVFGKPRPDFALAELFGVSVTESATPEITSSDSPNVPAQTLHTYLRLTPELRAQADSPKTGNEPAFNEKRHRILAGFDETDILPFGGTLHPLTVSPDAKVLATFIPPFPQSPPETVWMRTPRTDIPGLVVNESHGGRVAFLAADLDRQFALNNYPDHGDLLANLVSWAAGDTIPLYVRGTGLLNCELYQQNNRLILHVINLTSAGTWRAPIDELIPVGPIQIRVRLPDGFQPTTFRRLVAPEDQPLGAEVKSGWASFELKSVLDHQVVLLEA